MAMANVFRSGNSQALRLPKEFQFKSKEVEIFRRGDEIVLFEKSGHLGRVFDLLAGLPDDFDLGDRGSDFPQGRKRAGGN
jgi:antitoxin VapB